MRKFFFIITPEIIHTKKITFHFIFNSGLNFTSLAYYLESPNPDYGIIELVEMFKGRTRLITLGVADTWWIKLGNYGKCELFKVKRHHVQEIGKALAILPSSVLLIEKDHFDELQLVLAKFKFNFLVHYTSRPLLSG